MNLKLVLSLAVVAVTAFSMGAKVNGQPDDPAPRKASLGLTGYPLFYVDKTRPGSPTEKAGLKRGDLVMSINDRVIESPEALKESIAQVQVGQKVKIMYMRYEEEHHEYRIYVITVEAGERN